VTPEAYFKLCEAHDWNYDFSSDPQGYRKGARAQQQLINLAKEDAQLREIYLAWSRYAKPPIPQLSDFVPQNQTPG